MKIYKINSNFFETIDTEEKAYWLGFISADGGIDKHLKKRLSITLHGQDKRHLEKFLECLESTHPITSFDKTFNDGIHRFGCRVSINNAKIVSDLEKLGVGPQKSLTLKPCSEIPENLQCHYWRGMIDGDGSLFETARKSYRLCLYGSLDTLEGFKQWCQNYTSNKATIHPVGSISYYSIEKRQSVFDLLNILYTNCSIFLDRKKALADSFLATLLAKQQQRSAA